MITLFQILQLLAMTCQVSLYSHAEQSQCQRKRALCAINEYNKLNHKTEIALQVTYLDCLDK